ncbi:hypothetical protein BV25DRAFT_1922294 [Artomyces pyxidatus]|uniref:Uncharacterized protein n=1 Tax=Artomyces pyxidatus TaxID=48021 RepID=A0ACB8SEF6_9AGAM|nr:hypothetical protein BV25DRAFT_1922294 [Artomyces pyxidatus]
MPEESQAPAASEVANFSQLPQLARSPAPYTAPPRRQLGELDELEEWWVNHQEWLETMGYMLRPRYHPNWRPSWNVERQYFRNFEDGWRFPKGYLLDATRLSDGFHVILKRVLPGPYIKEVEVARYLTSEPLTADPQNHCVPILDILQVPGDLEEYIIVTPLLRPYENPPFETYGEAVDFFSQMFEAVNFMHKHHVAHRDCTHNNIMMDSSAMYPESFHPILINRRRGWKGKAKHYTRTQCPPRYYLIDFGLSVIFRPEDGPPLVKFVRGGDKSAPEHNSASPKWLQDPFPTDIYHLGNVIRENFIRRYHGFDFVVPLVSQMVAIDPAVRPTIEQVVAHFKDIRSAQSTWKMRSRIIPVKEGPLQASWRSIVHWYRRVEYTIRSRPAIPEFDDGSRNTYTP